MDKRTRPIGQPLFRKKISTNNAWLYRGPKRSAPKDTQALYGHIFTVFKAESRWSYGQLQSPITGNETPGYVGWILNKSLGESESSTHRIIVLAGPVFKGPDIKSSVQDLLPLGAHISVSACDNKFAKTNRGYVPLNYLAERECDYVDDFVKIAEAHLGRPYIWAGISSEGLDCSGLVLSALRAAGMDSPRDADMQEAHLGDDAALPYERGDLIFWPGHVGIMRDADTLLHANAHHMQVASEPLSEAINRIGPIRTVKRINVHA